MKIAFRLVAIALVFVAVSCGEKTAEPVVVTPPAKTAPAPVEKTEAKTKVDIKVNTKDGSVGVDVESKK